MCVMYCTLSASLMAAYATSTVFRSLAAAAIPARQAQRAGSFTNRQSLVAASHLLLAACWWRMAGKGETLEERVCVCEN